MTDNRMTDDLLNDHFAALKATQAGPVEVPSDDLMARVLADAEQVQADAAHAPATPKRRAASFGLLALIGGWPAAAGLVTAGVMGIWIGANPPSVLLQTSDLLLDSGLDVVVDMDLEGGL